MLHGGFDGKFFIWGECSFTRAGLHNLRRMRRIDGDTVVHHIWDPGTEKIKEALEEIGFSFRDERDDETREIALPTFAGKYPVPTTPLLGEIPSHHVKRPAEFGMKRWQVDAVSLDISDLLELLPTIPGGAPLTEHGCLLSHGIMIALDLCYAVECVRFAASLLERGRFLPDVRETNIAYGEKKYDSMWRPLLMGEDAEYFGMLTDMMPVVLRTMSPRPDASSAVVLGDFFDYIMDSMVRQAWSGKYKPSDDRGRSRGGVAKDLVDKASMQLDALLAERKKRGKLVSALNPHALWSRSLGWLGDAEGLTVSLESIYPDVREWWNRFEWFAKAPFKMCVRLSEMPDSNGDWSLDYSLKLLQTGEIIPASEVWTSPDNFADEVSGDYMRRYMLLLLGRIGAVVPAVLRSLERPAPTGCQLALSDTSDFLDYQAQTLIAMGVNVAYPDWWRPRSIGRLTVRGRLVAGTVDPSVFAYTVWSNNVPARDERLSFEWRMALDGLLLSTDEENLVRDGGFPLVNIRGRWVFIHRDQLSDVCGHVASLPKKLTAGEAVRLAVRDQYIDGFVDAPILEQVYDALRTGQSRVVLSTPRTMNGEMRPYQTLGYSWMAFLTSLGLGACLADDMGLGKTLQTLALIQHHRDMGDDRPVLVVCPTSVLENWRLEAERFFPGMSIHIHHGRGRDRGEDFRRSAHGANVVLTSYALLQRDASMMQDVDWLGMALDEAQNIKNPDTQQSRACRSIKADWRVVLTGTPIENHVGDLWSIMEFLMPGMLGSRRFFRNEFVKPIQESGDTALMDTLKRQVGPLIMRRMKTDRDIAPELPQKIETTEFCSLRKEQAKLYTDVTSDLSREVSNIGGIKRKGVVLAALTKIKQLCDHPALVSKDGDYSCSRSAKLDRLLSLAEEMFAAGDRALIFTQYVGMGDILKLQLQERFGQEVLFLHGAIFKAARDEMIRRFQSGEGPQFFVLSLKAGGVGLNLTGANHVVMYDRWWNPAVENQAIDRAFRIGQTRNVHVHTFCCRGTLEERIGELIESKKEVAERVIDGSENWITELSDRDLQKLLHLSPGAVEA